MNRTKEPWPPTEVEKLFSFSKAYGVPIEAAEFANEPNMMEDTGFPKGYHAEHYRRDTDIFAKWLKENYPECLYVGPSATGGDVIIGKSYGGVSERLASVMPQAHWDAEDAHGEDFLFVPIGFARFIRCTSSSRYD